MAGGDSKEGGQVYALPLGGTLVKVPFSIGEIRPTLLGRGARRQHAVRLRPALLLPHTSRCFIWLSGSLLVAGVYRLGSIAGFARQPGPFEHQSRHACWAVEVDDAMCAGGSGSAYIYAFCDKNWRPGMSEAECQAFVVRCVGHALARDGSSGGCIRTVSISKDGAKRSFLANDQACSPDESCLLVFLCAATTALLDHALGHPCSC